MIVEVRPLPTQKWHGKTGEESFTRPKKISALVDGRNMTYATGLNDEDAKKFGKIFNTRLDNVYDPDEPHPFWDSPLGVVKLENNTMFFDDKININKIRISLMKASKFVANSMKEWEEGKWPEAHHVIFDEAEEVEAKASKVALKQKAIVEQSKLSKTRKLQIILIMTGKDMQKQTDDFITVAMDDLVNAEPERTLRFIEQDKAQVANHALVIEAIQKNILRKDGHKIMYMDSNLGGDELDAAEYLMLDDNNDLKVRIMKAVSE